jgi:hypothetical protein
MKKTPRSLLLILSFAAIVSGEAKVITVNTIDNVSPGPNQTNLVQAIKLLADGDTIQFNIPGSGVQYIQTPTDGYPLITANSVTIDGYSQPGASPNSNPIHTPNNAVLKIALTSTNGNGLSMQIAITNHTGIANDNLGFGADEMAILGFYQSSNVTVKGLAFLSAPQVAGSGVTDADMKTISFCPDLGGQCENWHVSGCWFGVDPTTRKTAYMPDNTTVAMPAISIAAYRSRDPSGNNPTFPQPGTVGVAAGSTDPRAEFNVFVTGYGFDSEGLNFRISGNFFNVLPDGMTNFDPSQANSGNQQGDGYIEVGRVSDNLVIGTDGDGVNDADEGNVFGGVNSTDWANLYLWSAHATNIVIAGNWYGVALDGQTLFTNSSVVVHGVPGTAEIQFGSDFDGMSDDLEANVVFNNNPFAVLFPDPASMNSLEPGFFPKASAGARISLRGNKLVNNNLLPYSYADGLSDQLMNFTNYEALYMDTNADILPNLDLTNSIYPKLAGTFAKGIAPYTNVTIDVYQLDPEGWENGKLFLLPEMTDQSTFTNGFPQGAKYLKSFNVTNSGSFNLDLTGLDLGPGPVTVTVNYSADPPGTHLGRTHTGNFSNPGTLIPPGAASLGLTHAVPDVALWYNSSGNYFTNGPVDITQQAVPLDNWEPYISVLGDSTFLIGLNTFADDQTVPPGATYSGSAQRFVVVFQPAAGGPAKIGEHYFTDAGQPYRGVVNLSRENGNPQRVAGDKRHGAVNFIVASETSLGQLSAFKSDTRWSNNPMYQADNRYVTEQTFSLDPGTLVQTPLHNAWDYVYGPMSTTTPPLAGSGSQLSRTGGRPEALDNGNFVVMIDDKTGYSSTAGEVTTFAIITPKGDSVKGPTLVDPRDIWDNLTAYKGGLAIRVHNMLYFYDDTGSLQYTNDINVSSGLTFGTGREDASRIGSDIRSSYVYLAGQTPESGSHVPVSVAIWDSRTGNFVAKATVTDTDPTVALTDRVSIGVDALDRFCVAYSLQPTPDFTHRQVAARVMAFDGTNITYLTHSFFPFVNYENNPTNILGYETFHPSVAMTTMQICIAAKGQINSTNSPTTGPDTAPQTQVYTVINHPNPISPVPTIQLTATRSGTNLILSWSADAGDFTLQASDVVTTPRPWPVVSPQPPIVPGPGNTLTMTVPISSGNKYFQLAR